MDLYTWGYILAGAIAVLALCAVLVFMFRWRISFEGNEYSLVPSDVTNRNISALNDLEKGLADLGKRLDSLSADADVKRAETASELLSGSAKLDQRMQALLSAFRDLREEHQILKNEIEVKTKELERFKVGYDSQIMRRSLVPIARIHNELSLAMKADGAPGDQKAVLEALQEECLDVLENEGIELSWPKEGDRYSEYSNIRHPPFRRPAPDEGAVGLIASVISPAYQLTSAERSKVLMPATVEVFVEPEK